MYRVFTRNVNPKSATRDASMHTNKPRRFFGILNICIEFKNPKKLAIDVVNIEKYMVIP